MVDTAADLSLQSMVGRGGDDLLAATCRTCRLTPTEECRFAVHSSVPCSCSCSLSASWHHNRQRRGSLQKAAMQTGNGWERHRSNLLVVGVLQLGAAGLLGVRHVLAQQRLGNDVRVARAVIGSLRQRGLRVQVLHRRRDACVPRIFAAAATRHGNLPGPLSGALFRTIRSLSKHSIRIESAPPRRPRRCRGGCACGSPPKVGKPLVLHRVHRVLHHAQDVEPAIMGEQKGDMSVLERSAGIAFFFGFPLDPLSIAQCTGALRSPPRAGHRACWQGLRWGFLDSCFRREEGRHMHLSSVVERVCYDGAMRAMRLVCR